MAPPSRQVGDRKLELGFECFVKGERDARNPAEMKAFPNDAGKINQTELEFRELMYTSSCVCEG